MWPTHQHRSARPSIGVTPIFAGEAHLWIAASPRRVYDLVSDLSRMGEYSPECYKVVWLDGADGPGVGVRARGWNRFLGMRWSRIVEILVADPEREFCFQTVPQAPVYLDTTVWRYTFSAKDGGTMVRESYAMVKVSPWIHAFELLTQRPNKMPGWMQQTLERIKAVAEQAEDLA
jgi:Polyketide cyclase / dehydrase and lipid transport